MSRQRWEISRFTLRMVINIACSRHGDSPSLAGSSSFTDHVTQPLISSTLRAIVIQTYLRRQYTQAFPLDRLLLFLALSLSPRSPVPSVPSSS